MRRIAGAAVAAAIAVLVCVPAGASAQGTVVPSSVERSTVVPGGGSKSLTLSCPIGAVALNAAPVRRPLGVYVRASIPGDNARRWTLRFASRGSAHRVSAVLRCVRLNLPSGVAGVTLRVSSANLPVVVKPRSTIRVPLRCHSGYAPTGQGVGATSHAVSTVAAVPNRNGWTFRIENRGGTELTATPHIRCLQRVVTGRRKGASVRLAFDVRRRLFRHSVGAGGKQAFSATCAPGRFSLATGVSLDPGDDIVQRLGHPTGRRSGRWLFRNSGRSEPVKRYLLCLARDARFR